jgi:DNA-binding transcriptional ArsR family regulator
VTTPFADDYPEPGAVFGALADEACRALLAALTEPRTASELADATGYASSTVYDKLDRLEAAGLVDAATSVRRDGNHETVYAADVEAITVERDEDGALDVELRRPDRSASERLVDIWSEVKRG